MTPEQFDRRCSYLALAVWRCRQAGKHDMELMWAAKLRELICGAR